MEETVWIDGICSSSAIDTSGERISIEGLDISSLAKDGCFNYEHDEAKLPDGQKIQIKLPSNVVGKILKAKKIFSEQDCEDERERYYWNLAQCPFVYVMGCLFNKYTSSAADIAGKFRYDADHRASGQGNVLWYSVEGGKLAGSRQGIEITRSIARKVTITVMPANKQCIAEMIPNPKAAPKDDLDSLFKSYGDIEIELFKSEAAATSPAKDPQDQMHKSAKALGIDPLSNVVSMKKSAMSVNTGMTTVSHGPILGQTKSGKNVHANAKIHEYKGFSGADHQEAANMHHTAASQAGSKNSEHHLGKMKLHMQAAKTAENKGARMNAGRPPVPAMTKSLEAGSMNAAPGSLVGGAALQKESLHGKIQKAETGHEKGINRVSHPNVPGTSKASRYANPEAKGMHKRVLAEMKAMPKPKLEKTELLTRSEEEYSNWSKKEAFVEFMKSEHPELVMGEIEAFGKTLALSESIKMEEKLFKLIKS